MNATIRGGDGHTYSPAVSQYLQPFQRAAQAQIPQVNDHGRPGHQQAHTLQSQTRGQTGARQSPHPINQTTIDQSVLNAERQQNMIIYQSFPPHVKFNFDRASPQQQAIFLARVRSTMMQDAINRSATQSNIGHTATPLTPITTQAVVPTGRMQSVSTEAGSQSGMSSQIRNQQQEVAGMTSNQSSWSTSSSQHFLDDRLTASVGNGQQQHVSSSIQPELVRRPSEPQSFMMSPPKQAGNPSQT